VNEQAACGRRGAGRQGSVKRRTESGTGKGGFNPLVFYDRLPQFDSRVVLFLTPMLSGKKENET
jgi:hypothetical protein